MMLSGFLTWKAVSQGQKGPGEALVSFGVKASVCIILVTFVCANIPPALIGISNSITSSVASWFGGSANKEEGADLIETTYKNKTQAAHTILNGMISKVLTSLSIQPDEYKTEISKANSKLKTKGQGKGKG
jgi:hypothetical protein